MDEGLALAEKWFGDIPAGGHTSVPRAEEPPQREARFSRVQADVPAGLVYKVYHMAPRMDPTYYAQNLLSDVLGNGEASRLEHRLKQERKLFTDIGAYVSGSLDTGMFVVSGRLAPGVDYESADAAIEQELDAFLQEGPSDREHERVIHMVEAELAGQYTNALNRAQGLALAEMAGDVDLVNTEIDHYRAVTARDIHQAAQDILRPEAASTMYYGA